MVLLLALVAGAGFFAIKRSGARRVPIRPRASGSPHGEESISPMRPDDHPRSTPIAPVRPRPAELGDFQMLRAADLAEDRKQAIVTVFRDIPRPPRLLQHLLSPDFVSAASSAELVDLIAGEPLIAAKVLGTVNSPFYALKAPVHSIEQAVSLLGLNAVRSVCLQYLLIQAFKSDSAERQQILDRTWSASAVASEIVQQLSSRLDLPERGIMASAVVLSFLGHLATAATMPRGVLATIPTLGYLARSKAEQQKFGVCSSEIGRLLMLEWGLPAQIVEDAAESSRLLTTPCTGLDPTRESRLALCYLSARLGERLAFGQLSGLTSFDLEGDTDPDYFNVQAFLGETLTQRVTGQLRSSELNDAVVRVLRATRSGL